MNKRDAAKKFKGDQLDALALGAGISRNENETDEALRARLLAAYDAEDKQRREAEEAQQRAADDAAAAETARRAEEEAKRQSGAKPMTKAEADAAARRAVEDERQRVSEIGELAKRAGMNADADKAFVEEHVRKGTSVEDFRTALFDKLIEREERSPTFPHSETRGMQDAQDTQRKQVANAILHRNGVVTDLMEGANEWRSMSALEIAKDLLQQRGEKTRGLSVHEVVQRALHTTSDFPVILGDVTRQTLIAGYGGYENTFQLVANRNVVSDFHEVKMLELGQGPDLEKVNEHGEFKRGTVRESEEGIKIATYGKVIGLTRQMIINDHLGAFTRMISDWGRKAAKLEGDIVWGVIINNAKLKDGKALFHADHKNLAGTGTALDETNLTAAHLAFRQQTDIDGEPINISPKFLFHGAALEVTADKLINGVYVAQSAAATTPKFMRSLTPVYEYRLDKIATKAWFLFAEMAQTMGRGLQYAYLAGQEAPFFDERVGFDVDGIEYKIRHDFGAGVTDYRFAYKNVGV